MRVIIVWLALSASALAQEPRLVIRPDTVLTDERFELTLTGFPPARDVTVRASGMDGVWTSAATFRADASGAVAVSDPMTFIWSATGDRASARPNFTAMQTWVFSAEVAGQVVASDTVWRRAVAAGVRVVPVRERGLVGTAYFPADTGRHAAIIVVPGSSGGIPGPGSFVGGLASRGYVVLALAFFNAEGLRPTLQEVPLEYFATAAEWLRAQPSVDSSRIGFMGTSRGGELALLVGATYPSLCRVIVANVPSSVVWPGMSSDADTPAWTLNGKPLRHMAVNFGPADRALSSRERFLRRMRDARALDRAAIPVEKIGAPLLLFGSKDDQVWPSDIFVGRIVRRLKSHHFAHPMQHYLYEDAGHTIGRPYVPTSDVRAVTVHPISKRRIMFGGTPEGQARANEDAWARLVTFLDRYLRDARVPAR